MYLLSCATCWNVSDVALGLREASSELVNPNSNPRLQTSNDCKRREYKHGWCFRED